MKTLTCETHTYNYESCCGKETWAAIMNTFACAGARVNVGVAVGVAVGLGTRRCQWMVILACDRLNWLINYKLV